MNEKYYKLEVARIGNYAVKCIDICTITQRDGKFKYTVGVVGGKVKESGKYRVSMQSLARVIEREGIHLDVCAAMNPFTKSFTDEPSAARACYKFGDKFKVAVGERASAIGRGDDKMKAVKFASTRSDKLKAARERLVRFVSALERNFTIDEIRDMLIAVTPEKVTKVKKATPKKATK